MVINGTHLLFFLKFLDNCVYCKVYNTDTMISYTCNERIKLKRTLHVCNGGSWADLAQVHFASHTCFASYIVVLTYIWHVHSACPLHPLCHATLQAVVAGAGARRPGSVSGGQEVKVRAAYLAGAPQTFICKRNPQPLARTLAKRKSLNTHLSSIRVHFLPVVVLTQNDPHIPFGWGGGEGQMQGDVLL